MSSSCPFTSANMRLIQNVEESKALKEARYPCIIISASGTLAGGRILHHLKHRLPDHRNTILFVGFQPEGSLGRLILEGQPRVKIHGATLPVRARIEQLDALSAHADAGEILHWMGRFKQAPRRLFLVHGELPAQQALKARLERVLDSRIEIPDHEQEFALS